MILSKLSLELDFERQEFIKFLEQGNLVFDEVDEVFVYREQDKIVASGGYKGNVIKLLCVDENHRDMGLIPKLVTHIKEIMFKKGIKETFVFTKPEYEKVFTSIFYEVFARTDKVMLLTDSMDSYYNWIDSVKKEGKYNGCIVMNANPFTRGHRYLAEYAAREITGIIVFVVEADKSYFSFDERFKMVNKGLEDIWLSVLPAGKFIISELTFPTYFLKKEDDYSKEFAKLDAAIFIDRIAKDLGLKYRFVGEENSDALTRSYNEALIEKARGSELKIIVVPRKKVKGKDLSASYVREHLDELDSLVDYLPESTMEIIKERDILNDTNN